MGDTDDKVADAKVEVPENVNDVVPISKEEVIEVVESESTKKTSTNPSEYDSADSFSDAEGEIPVAKDDADVQPEHSESEESGSVTLEREEGDGQESVQSKKVDDDEDKKNPQYIPKRGTFYEHDDRTAEDDCNEEPEVTEEADKATTEKDGKKKIWTDKKEKWNHDKFNDDDQAPKSKQELVAIYGYDIRNEDGPPRARRRRRYGRGPNKYTRNWEDEDAYNKAQPATKKPIVKKTRPGGRGSQQDDDEHETGSDIVVETHHHNRTNSEEANSSGRQSTENSAEFSDRPIQNQRREFTPRTNNSYTERYNNKNQRVGTGRIVKPNREIRDSDYKGFTKPRQYTSHKSHVNEDVTVQNVQSRNYTNRKHVVDMEKEMGRMSLNEQGHHSKGGKQHPGNRQGPMPPRLQTEPKGSKRYSSMRQRSLPESSNANFNQQTHNYYPNEFQQQNQVSNPQQQQPPQPLIQTMQSQMPAIPPPPLPSIPPQVPVTTTPLPPQYANPFPQPPPAFLQPAPPPFITQPSAPMLNYVQGQPPYAPPQAPFQAYQQQYNPVSQPTEIFQPPGGITYYSTQEQQAAQRAAIQKRPKAAIPIVPPPPLEPRGRGRATNHDTHNLSMNNSSDILELHPDNNAVYEDVVQVQP